MSDEFYIGYETAVPPRSRRLVFGSVAAAIAVASVLAATIVASQRAFADSRFDFGARTEFSGTIVADPYPTLVTETTSFGLVAAGKHGADELVRAYAGQAVTLRGALIRRNGWSLIEVVPGTIEANGRAAAALRRDPRPQGSRTLVGEIVDGKCYLGVMNPGEGTAHRDCAAVCIRGGLPPMFATTLDGESILMTMTTRDGRAIGPAVAPLAGRRVVVSGIPVREDSPTGWTLRADAGEYRLVR